MFSNTDCVLSILTFMLSAITCSGSQALNHSEVAKLYKIPHFYGETIVSTDSTFKLVLNFDKSVTDMAFYEICVLKLNKDHNGFPRLINQDPKSWTDYSSYTAKEPARADLPYIAGRFRASVLPLRFTVGDDRHYGGFRNGKLTPDTYYAVFIRGVVQRDGKTYHVVSNYVSDAENPAIPEIFFTSKASDSSIALLSIGMGSVAVFITLFFVMCLVNGKILGRRTSGNGTTRSVSYTMKKRASSHQMKPIASSGTEEVLLPKVPKRKKYRKSRETTHQILSSASGYQSTPTNHTKTVSNKKIEKQLTPYPRVDGNGIGRAKRKPHENTKTDNEPKDNQYNYNNSNPDVLKVKTVGSMSSSSCIELQPPQRITRPPPPTVSTQSPETTPKTEVVIVNETYDIPDLKLNSNPKETPTVPDPRVHMDTLKTQTVAMSMFDIMGDDKVDIEKVKLRMKAYRYLIAEKMAGHIPDTVEVNDILLGRTQVPKFIADNLIKLSF